jgi:hypothetical protein
MIVMRRMIPEKPFALSVKKVRALDVPDGIIAHLTTEYRGNVYGRHVIHVTSGPFEKETRGANPHSGAYDDDPENAAKNAANLETDSRFKSAYRTNSDYIQHPRNNWICYHFKERGIVPTDCTIRMYSHGPGGSHVKSWLVETLADGENWQEVFSKGGKVDMFEEQIATPLRCGGDL